MKKWTGALQIAAVYVGTVIGAGFATGREIVEFFSRFGLFGLLTILLAGYLFIAFGAKLMEKAIDLEANSYEQLNEYLFRQPFAQIMNLLMLCMLIGVCAVMLSGAGAVFEEQLGFRKMYGIFMTIGLTIFVMKIGTRGLFAVNSFVVPLMLFFNFILVIKAIGTPSFLQNVLHIPPIEAGWEIIVSPFAYVAFNLALAQAVLVPIATEVNDKDIVRLGGIIGGVFLTIILLCSHLTLIMLPQLTLYEIPMGIIVKNTAANIYIIYICIIYGEIFTSIIGNIYGVEKQLSRYIPVRSMIIYGGVLIIAFLISHIEYGKLLSYLYPLFGYISILFLFLLAIRCAKEA